MLEQVEQRLEAIQVNNKPLFRYVDSALSLSTVLNNPINQSPAAFVVPVSDRPGKNAQDIGPALQKVSRTIGVVIALKSVNDPTGKRGSELLESTRESVRKALFGWSPSTAYSQFELGPSDMITMNNNGIWWLDKFVTDTYEEASNG